MKAQNVTDAENISNIDDKISDVAKQTKCSISGIYKIWSKDANATWKKRSDWPRKTSQRLNRESWNEICSWKYEDFSFSYLEI